jgi:rare lipoprotein A (peptidoglycan hydrolase)
MNGAGKRTRTSFGARRAAIVAACALGALAAAGPAAAQTGGASTVAASDAEAGGGIAFTALRSAGATWYGPGFYGRQTACGQVLRPGTLGVAHRNLPCGTAVKFVYGGRQIVTRVIDRGPYTKGFSWDLTNGAREALRFEGSGQIRYAVALHYARH